MEEVQAIQYGLAEGARWWWQEEKLEGQVKTTAGSLIWISFVGDLEERLLSRIVTLLLEEGATFG